MRVYFSNRDKYVYNLIYQNILYFQFFILIAILTLPMKAQIPLKAPEKKTYMYEREELTYYDDWASYLRIETANIKARDSFIKELRFNDLNNAYWNRLIAYYNMVPNDPADILYSFFDGIDHDKDAFCYNYKSILRSSTNLNLRATGKRAVHFKKELEIMDTICDCVFKSYSPRLLKILDELKENDQKYRKQNAVLPKAQKRLDSINLSIVLDLYDQYGYLNRKIVGIEYESHMFYIIQHADLETMERFLPIIHKEIVAGRLDRKVYPLLHDRVNMLNGLPQEFGTQGIFNQKTDKYELYKTVGREKVNINRKKYGYPPLK